MANLYTDENFTPKLIFALIGRGHNVLTANRAGLANCETPDEYHLRFAYKENRILITFNRSDFGQLHKQGHPHCGIIVCHQPRRSSSIETDQIAAGIDKKLRQRSGSIEGELIKVYINKTP